MRTVELALAFGGLSLLVDCGGGSPSSPTSTTPARLVAPSSASAQFVNGLDHAQDVSGLTVTVSGATLAGPTGTDGRSSSAIPDGAGITTRGRSDYLDREAFFSSTSPQVGLWHLDAAHDAAYYKKLVYERPWAPTTDYLMRPDAGTYTVSVSVEIKKSPVAMEWVETALAEATRITSLADQPIHFAWLEAGGQLSFEINGADPAITGSTIGADYLAMNGRRITGGRVVIKSLEWAETRNTALHEIGHFLGFAHSREPGDPMYYKVGHTAQFSPGETTAWVMMSQRKPGNRYPDQDPSVSMRAAAPREMVVVCP
jgi:hypothetical protein